MTLLFQYPALLGLLALAVLPALIHFLARARPAEFRFPSTAFLSRVLLRSSRAKRPKEWWLLILRTITCLALATCFASPYLLADKSALPGEQRTVVLLIDRSASMAASEGAADRLVAATTKAISLLRGSQFDLANIIWLDAKPDAVFSQPDPNREALVDQLKSAQALPESADVNTAIDLAVRQLQVVKGHRELIILSDFQQTQWRQIAPTIPNDINVSLHRIGSSSPVNLAITNISAQPSAPVVGQKLSILTRVSNFSAEPIHTQLTLNANGSQQTQSIEIPAWGETQSAFPLQAGQPGALAISVSLDGDAYPLDNARHYVLPIRESLRMQHRSDSDKDPQVAEILQRVANALPWLEYAPYKEDAHADVLFITDWNGQNAAELRSKAEKNRVTLIVQPQASCPRSALDLLSGKNATGGEEALGLDASTPGWKALPSNNHPSMALFSGGDFGNPFAGFFHQRCRIKLDSLPVNAQIIAQYQDDVPAMYAIPTGGSPILICNLSLSPTHTDWASQSEFLPAIGEMILHHLPSADENYAPSSPGAPISWRSFEEIQTGSMTLLGPDGKEVALTQESSADGFQWSSSLHAVPGIYRWQSSGQDVHLTAVNFPAMESDLRPMEKNPSFAPIQDASSGSLSRAVALSRGLSLWHWLALAAFIAIVIEGYIATPSKQSTAATSP